MKIPSLFWPIQILYVVDNSSEENLSRYRGQNPTANDKVFDKAAFPPQFLLTDCLMVTIKKKMSGGFFSRCC